MSKEIQKNNKYEITENDKDEIINQTKGYSGSDLIGVCREAAMMPLRDVDDIYNLNIESLREVMLKDFLCSIKLVKPSVNEKTLTHFVQWNKDYGSFQFDEKDLEN